MNEQTRVAAEIRFPFAGAYVSTRYDASIPDATHEVVMEVSSTSDVPATARQAVRDKLHEIRDAIDEELWAR
jgi:hypothetical protein